MSSSPPAIDNKPAAEKLQVALVLFQQGRLEDSQKLCAALLAADPRYFDALHLTGLIAYQAKAFERAAEILGKALDIHPGSALAHNNRGLALMELKQPLRALDHFDKAIAQKPAFASAQNNRGNALRTLGRLAEALAGYDTALSQKGDYADAWYNRGLALHDLKQFEQALQSCRQALVLKPDYAAAHNTCGLALKELGQAQAAVEAYDKALAIKPDLAEAWTNRGVALQSLQRYEEALRSYDQAIAYAPEVVQTWSNRGSVLNRLRRSQDALQSYDRAVALDPTFANAWNNRGVTLVDLGQRAEALLDYEKAVALDPDNADAHWNMSLCHLQLGNFEKGWAGHEWRWKAATLVLAPRHFTEPQWRGDAPLQGKTILLYADQGFGDALQFCRYAKLLQDRGAKVILEVGKALVPLLTGLDGTSRVIATGDALPAFDFQSPLGSLPAAFKADANNIPMPAGYLRAADGKRAAWRARLGAKTKRRVGLVWSGNTQHTNDHNRSIPLADFLKMLPPGLDYVSLQRDVHAEDRAALRTRADIRDIGGHLADFSDTAALADLMDVIISVDTSVVHLAGAMGRPVWVLLPFNPDWRWMLERSDSPWYASARLYRQKRAGDWAEVFEAVKADVQRLSAT